MIFTNFSRVWTIEISWVGEDSALVSRSVLQESETHMEVMSAEHVWCITAYRKGNNVPKADSKKEIIDPIERVLHEKDAFGNYSEDVKEYSSVSVLFRPPPTTQPTMYTPGLNVLWVPWNSLSFSEYSRRNVDNKKKSHDSDDTFLFFKIFDFSPVVRKRKDEMLQRKK